MESTYPLRQDLIQCAIDELAAGNAQARDGHEREAGSRPTARLLQSGGLHARVTGPVEGYYIASCASRTGDAARSYLGSYKICQDAPASYWEAVTLVAGSCRHSEPTGLEALACAEAIAVLKIADMPIRIDRA